MDHLLEELTKRHPDCLIDILFHYSPGVTGRVKPFVSGSVKVNGETRYYGEDGATIKEALDKLYVGCGIQKP